MTMNLVSSSAVNSNPRTQAAIAKVQSRKREKREAEGTSSPTEMDNIHLRKQVKNLELEISVLKEKLGASERKYAAAFGDLTNLKGSLSARDKKAIECKHNMREIAAWVCKVHKITLNELMSGRRDIYLAYARACFCYWARELTPASFPEIGRFIDRDHTTVIHAARTYKEKRAKHAKQKQASRSMDGATVGRWWQI